MRMLRYATYLWPGLPRLWFEGAWTGLALAVGFGLLFNFLLLASLVWVQLCRRSSGGWLGWPRGDLGRERVVCRLDRWTARSAAEAAARDDLFRRALGEYLKGAWFEAESLLGQLVAQDTRDVDARLMLASLLRHTRPPAGCPAAIGRVATAGKS